VKKRSPFRDTWKDYFSFSKRERRGILAILLIIFLQIIFLLYLKYFPVKDPPQDFTAFKKEVDSFYVALDRSNIASEKTNNEIDAEIKLDTSSGKIKRPTELFAFNPNNLPVEDWRRLGFSDKQIKVIKNYEAKGGKFYSKENVRKMYCITETQFARIEPFIAIPDKAGDHRDTTFKKHEFKPLMVDIGIADSVELTKLRGIGPGFGRRISIYRDKLGGFKRMEQLMEVWGFSDSLYQSLLPNICLRDSDNIRKLSLNNSDFKGLKDHPYIGYQLAGLICNYRKQHAGFKSVEEIKKIPLVNEQLYSKLAPYLKTE